MGRSVTDVDIGLTVLREAPEEETQIIDIVAIHGLGAHPDDSWCKNAGTRENPRWINWLKEESMLPAVVPSARIMRYGYQSQWFGSEAMQQSVSTVADRLLRALKRKRKDVLFRPLLFVAHCFGGLVVLKALLEAEQYQKEWPGVFSSTTGLVFFGTPFRGAGGMKQMEMLDAARREYHEDEVQPTALEVLQPGNAYLQDLVDSFLKKMRNQINKTQIACFFELTWSNVGRIVGKQDRMRFVVSESSGCLDLSDATNKYSLSRTHFDMNKFAKATEEDFETVADVVKDMVQGSPTLLWARSQYYSEHKIDFHLKGVPTVGAFVPRDAEMQELERRLIYNAAATSRQKVVVLYGLGGIGKTQLAVEFARKHHHTFSSTIWLDGSSEASLKQSFVGMAHRLPQDELTADGIEMLRQPAINANEAVRECLQWLSLASNHRWLLIYDNIDCDFYQKNSMQAYNVKTYFPSTDHGSILVTTRLASLQRLGSGIKVGTVEEKQARAILENNAGRVIEDADMILERLSGLPLALTQAGSYIQMTNVSASTYAKYYDKTWEVLMQRQGQFLVEEYGDRNVLTTWTISYEQLRNQSEEATWLLKLWGFLDHGELWYGLVAAGSRLPQRMDTPKWLLKIAEDELAYVDAVGLLSRYSLADAKKGSNSHSMHSVLHRWCGQLAEDKERYGLNCMAAGIVALNVPHESEAEFWIKRKRLLDHATSVSRQIMGEYFTIDRDKEERTERRLIHPLIYYRLGYLLAGEDQPKEAEAMYERALRGYEKALGTEHTSTLDTVNDLGLLYHDQGKFDKAQTMYERALRGRENALGAEDPATLQTVNNLGNLYNKKGKPDQAETLYKRALRGYEKVLGPGHIATVDATNDLGTLYADWGRRSEAEALFEQALQGREKALGAEHPSTLNIINNLGALYQDQGRLSHAETMFERALQGKEKALGAEHRSTLTTVNNLGRLYKDQGRLDKAETMYKRVIIVGEKTGRAEDRSILGTVNSLANLYVKQGQLDKAEAMFERALKAREKVLGAEDTSTLMTANNLGRLYKDRGWLGKAEAMYQRTLRECETAIKPESLSTYVPALNIMWSLASLYHHQHRVEDARAWYSKALAGYESALGTDHTKCQRLRSSLTALGADEVGSLQAELSVQRKTSEAPLASTKTKGGKSASKRHRVFSKLGLRGG